MGDVRELGQDGMSRLPWIPWDTGSNPPPPHAHTRTLSNSSQPLSETSGTLLSDSNMEKDRISIIRAGSVLLLVNSQNSKSHAVIT